MEKPIIEVKNIGKRYRITHQAGKYIALRDVVANIVKKPFSFLADKARSAAGLKKKEEFWALRGVNFTVNKGEVVGIIGHNGAGKSTLLKILSQITPPTEGEIILRGTVGSLLEVGTGFHPELSGRENIFLNGAILGMHRREIAAKFDQIVEFAGIEKFLDTPVKYYSSGMYVRLAFSVAAHMEPDILVIDEVLAVGDAEFQKKCLGKMDEITKKDGRTILFVSHNMTAIQSLCQRTILMEQGHVKMIGETSNIIDEYAREGGSATIPPHARTDRKGDGRLQVTDIDIKGSSTGSISSGDDLNIIVKYDLHDASIRKFDFSLGIDNKYSNRIALISSEVLGKSIEVNAAHTFEVCVKNLPLNVGDYFMTVFIQDNRGIIDWVQRATQFMVSGNSFYPGGTVPKQGDVLLNYDVVNT